MLISRASAGVVALSLSAGSAIANAGGPPQIFDWINPSGGEFSEGENWSPLGPPNFQSTIRFDLAASYLVTAESFFVNTAMIGRDDVRIELSVDGTGGKGEGYADFGTLFIGGGAYDFPRDLDAPGSLTLTGELFSYNQAVLLGDGQLASRLILEPGAVIATGDFAMSDASSIVYRLDANSMSFGSIVEASFADELAPNGAIQVGNSLDGAPPCSEPASASSEASDSSPPTSSRSSPSGHARADRSCSTSSNRSPTTKSPRPWRSRTPSRPST